MSSVVDNLRGVLDEAHLYCILSHCLVCCFILVQIDAIHRAAQTNCHIWVQQLH